MPPHGTLPLGDSNCRQWAPNMLREKADTGACQKNLNMVKKFFFSCVTEFKK